MHGHWMLRTGAAGAAILCGICCASAAESTAAAMARVVRAPAVDATESTIRFGSFTAATEPQTVTIHPDGGRTVRGTVPAGVRQAHPFGPATVVVSGTSLMFSVALPAGAVLTTGSGALSAAVLHVTDFRLGRSGRDLLAEASQAVFLGATVSIPGKTAAGMYSGNIAVTVAYD